MLPEIVPTAGRVLDQVSALDLAVYRAIAGSQTPDLDRFFGRLSDLADHSKLWIATAAALALTGPRGRRAAADGLVAVAVTSALVNLVAKNLLKRPRPDRVAGQVPLARHVDMPGSTSFPSGHAASAYAFAGAVGSALPVAGVPIHVCATLVAYSRVHTGVHYPGDVIVGALAGRIIAPITSAVLQRGRAPHQTAATRKDS